MLQSSAAAQAAALASEAQAQLRRQAEADQKLRASLEADKAALEQRLVAMQVGIVGTRELLEAGAGIMGGWGLNPRILP